MIDVIKGNAAPDEIDWNLGFDPTDVQKLMMSLLEDASITGDGNDIENALALSFSIFDENKELLKTAAPTLAKLLIPLNHYRHEDIVRLLQQGKNEQTVEAIYNAAFNIPDYQQRYDEGAALIRKCTWALADIGTEAAYRKLELLGNYSNEEIAGYAKKRIRLWEEEQSRKAHHFLP